MKKNSLSFALFTVLLSFFMFGCGEKQVAYNSNADQFIESITPTGIDRLTPVYVTFVNEPKGDIGDCVKLSPAVEGSWEVMEKGAKFTPSVPYNYNSKLSLTVDCNKLFRTGNPDDVYSHSFIVSAPRYSVNFDEVRYNDTTDSYTFSGNVVTDIPVTQKVISKVVNAKLGGKKYPVLWEKGSKAEQWNFTLSGISPYTKNQSLKLSWSGNSMGVSKKQDKLFSGSKVFNIPSKSDFSIIDVNTSKPNVILVSFSKTLDLSQDIASFVRSYNFDDKLYGKLNSSIRGNVVSIFSDNNFENIQKVDFDSGIRSSDGIYLARAENVVLSDHWDLPEVKFKNDNVILPTSQGTILPIETKNLSGIVIQVYEIYDRNIAHFLQNNELNETSSLYRVGEPVWEKKVPLEWNNEMQNRMVSRGLDLTELIKKYPAGMFHIRITFRKDQIKYVCSKGHESYVHLEMPPDTIEPYSVPNQRSSWDSWEERNSGRSGYWYHRDDPCHPAFYMPNYNSKNLISRNVLVSDLGIMVKRTADKKLYVSVADIKTASPVKDAEIKLLSYVGTDIGSGMTDKEGRAVFNDNGKVFVISATKNGQTSYLKIANGTSLSVSHFEVGGEIAENGVKGFIYGERGVWRPGDDIYLTFVLQDLKKILPENIPVKFELSDPLGRVTDSRLLSESLNGFYPISAKTDEDATTGNWLAKVTIGGKSWTKSLKIETVVPNRLAIEFTSENEILNSEVNNFTLKSAWLHGAETPDYNAEISVAFSEASTSFAGYNDFVFSNPSNKIDSSRKNFWKGKLDSNSTARFSKMLNAGNNLPGKLKANFVTKVFEPAGGFSTQSKSFDYSPYSRYVGIKLPKGDEARNMLLTDVDHTVDVVLLDQEGKPVGDINSLSYNVYKLEWKWWWEKDAYTSATYVSYRYYNKVAGGNVSVVNGKGSFKFQVKYPDWGRYIVIVNDGSGHSAGQIVYIDWPGWAGRAQESGSGSASMVPLTSEKKLYKAGDTAEINFTASDKARALVTLEKSGRIIGQRWVEAKAGTNQFKFKVTDDMVPNVYVHVTLLQPHLQTANSLPIRLYGVLPLMVESDFTKLNPVITAPEKFEPNKAATVSVSEANGKPMTYTIAVVDEGLLGLTNHHPKNPASEFYKKEASQLESWDIYRYVMNAYSGKLETLLSIGGGEEINDDARQNQNRFTPVVKYFGPYYLEAGEKKATTFTMPSYVGAVRTMVVAGTPEGAYGTAEKTTVVKSDLMVQSSIPRTLGANEKIDIPVTVFNGENEDKEITVSLKTKGAFIYSDSKAVSVKASSEETVVFKISTFDAGNVTFQINAKSDKTSVESVVEVPVKSRGIPVTYRTPFVVKKGKSEKVTVNTPTEKGSASLYVELSSLPPIDLTNRLNYLIQYPHGCIEQITSGGFPQLYIPSYEKLSDEKSNEIKQNVLSVFERYPAYQTSSGGFGYWPGNTTPHAWGTTYAVHFMTEAKKMGYSVPSAVYDPALKWLEESAEYYSMASDESTATQAYRLFVLALARKENIRAMNRLQNEDLSKEAILLLASAYANAGQQKVAQTLLKRYKPSETEYRYYSYDFSSSVREKALFLYAGTKINNNSAVAKAAKEITDTLNSDKSMNTQETVWSLCALIPYNNQLKNSGFAYEIDNYGNKISDSVNNISVIEQLNIQRDAPQQTITVSNKGNGFLYGTLVSSGTSIPGTEAAKNDKLGITVSLPYNMNSLKIGDTFTLTVTVVNESRKDIENIALTVPVPTCVEFDNNRLAGDMKTSNYTYQDIRDDVIYTYFDLRKGASATYSFQGTIAYNGNYYFPAIHAEAMYDESASAIYPGKVVQMR